MTVGGGLSRFTAEAEAEYEYRRGRYHPDFGTSTKHTVLILL